MDLRGKFGALRAACIKWLGLLMSASLRRRRDGSAATHRGDCKSSGFIPDAPHPAEPPVSEPVNLQISLTCATFISKPDYALGRNRLRAHEQAHHLVRRRLDLLIVPSRLRHGLLGELAQIRRNSIFGISNWRPLVFVATADAAIEFLDVGVIPTFAVVSRMHVNPFMYFHVRRTSPRDRDVMQ
jgi:hypothetical protein